MSGPYEDRFSRDAFRRMSEGFENMGFGEPRRGRSTSRSRSHSPSRYESCSHRSPSGHRNSSRHGSPSRASSRHEDTSTQFNLPRTGDRHWSQSFSRRKPFVPDRIVSGLYISNIKTAAAYLLGEVDSSYPLISRIVSVIQDDHHTRYDVPKLPDPQPRSRTGGKIKHMRLSHRDKPETELIADFDKAVSFIYSGVQAYQRARDKGSRERHKVGAVLVHCHAGISRSATIITAYILKHRPQLLESGSSRKMGWSQPWEAPIGKVRAAINHVAARRTSVAVKPNKGFAIQLQAYHDLFECRTHYEDGRDRDSYREWLKKYRRLSLY